MLWALDHARNADTITLVNVWEPSLAMVDAGLCEPDDDTGARSLLHHELVRAMTVLGDSPVILKTEVLRGDPRHCLCELDADLLVVGARGQGALTARLLGSVSYYLARHAQQPLAIIPARNSA